MAMTTEEAMAFAEKLHTESQTEQTVKDTDNSQTEKQEVAPVVDKDCSTNKTNQDEETTNASALTDKASTLTNNKPQSNANSDKASYAFAREKSKRKELKKHYEQQIADLKKQLTERLAAKPGNDDVSALVDYKLESARLKDTIENVESNMRDLYADDVQMENDRRIANAWSSEADREQYRTLLESNGKMFLEALNKYDPDNVVLDYLDGQQDYPLLLKELMTNVESLKSVFTHRDTMGRLMALDSLNRKLHSTKPTIAKIGRLVRNETVSNTTTKKNNEYWNNWLKNHPRHY
jgi:hypothetical protein